MLNSLVFSFSTTVRAMRDSFREASQTLSAKMQNHRFRFTQRHVALKCILCRNGLGGPIGDNRTNVDSTAQFVEANSVAPKATLKCR